MKKLAILLSLLLASAAQAAVFTPQALSVNGIAPTYNAASVAGDSFANDGKTFVHLKNGSGASVTATFDAISGFNDNAFGDVALADTVVTVPAGGERIVGIFPPSRFNDVNGRVAVTYSAVTSLSIAVIRTGKTYP